MTVSTTGNRAAYTGNGVTTAFGFSFAFLATGDIKVYLDGSLQSTGYTVSAAPAPSGTVTFSGAPANGVEVVIHRETTKTQNIDYVANDPFAADVTERGFDRAMLGIQDNAAGLSRTLRVADYLPPINPITDPDNIVVSFTRRGEFDVADYGGALDGATDDLAALTAAVAAAIAAGGGTVTWNGYLRLNSGYTAPTGSAHIRLAPKAGGVIYSPSHNFDVLTIGSTCYGWVLDGVRFEFLNAPSGATEYWLVNSACDSILTKDLTGLRNWSGLKITGPKAEIRGRTVLQDMRVGLGRGLLIQQPASPTTEICFVERIVCIAAGGSEYKYGVHVVSGAAIWVSGDCFKAITPLMIEPGSGEVVATLVIPWFQADTSTSHGVHFAGAGTIQRVSGSVISSSNAGHGIFVSNIPRSADVWARCVDNDGRGVFFEGGDHKNSRWRIMAGGNGADGVLVNNGASKLNLEIIAGNLDDFGTNGGVGLYIGTGCSDINYTIEGEGGAYTTPGSGNAGGKVYDATGLPSLASAGSIALPKYGETFLVSGTINIAYLTTNYWPGRRVTLIFQGSLTVVHNATPAATEIALSGAANFSAANRSSLSLVHNGTQWIETGRKA